MKKLLFHLRNLNQLSYKILWFSILICGVYIAGYFLLLYTYQNAHTIRLLLACCVEAYPLLCLMSLSLCISAAALIDIYVKTQIHNN